VQAAENIETSLPSTDNNDLKKRIDTCTNNEEVR